MLIRSRQKIAPLDSSIELLSSNNVRQVESTKCLGVNMTKVKTKLAPKKKTALVMGPEQGSPMVKTDGKILDMGSSLLHCKFNISGQISKPGKKKS